MNKSNNSKSLDLKAHLASQLVKFSKVFDNSAHSTWNSESSEVKEQYVKIIEKSQRKGKKLLEISKTLMDLSENYFKSLKKLEEYKENAEYRMEILEIALENSENQARTMGKKIEDLNAYIEDVERHLLEVSSQRDGFKKDFKVIKEAHKKMKLEMNDLLDQEKNKFVKRIEEDSRKLENLKAEAGIKDRNIETLEDQIRNLQRGLEKEKDFLQKSRNLCERLKSDVFELKNKLSEEKLKKSNYKDLYKDLIQVRAVKCRNYSVQTVDEMDIDLAHSHLEDEEQENDLYSLEEEQSKAHSFSCSLEFKENFNGIKNQFCLISYPSERLNYQNCDSVHIKSQRQPKASLNLQFLGGFSLVNRQSLIKTANLYTLSKRQIKDKAKNGKLAIKKKKVDLELEFISVKHPSNVYSAPTSPTTQVVQIRKWDEAGDSRVETPVVEVSQIEPEEVDLDWKQEKKKGYLASFCQGVRVTCEYGSKIKPRELFSSIGKLKRPISAWPSSLSGFIPSGIQKRYGN